MKKIIVSIGGLTIIGIVTLLMFSPVTNGGSICFPYSGCNASSSKPTLSGQFLISLSTGIFTISSFLDATGTASTVKINTCGTSPSIVGSWGGKITTGTNASSTCTVLFGTAFINDPSCVVSSETTTSTVKVTHTSTTMTIFMNSSTEMKSAKFDYHCIDI